jgi:signal transduction histidine kinase
VTQDAAWARFAVHNATADARTLLLMLAEPRTSQIAFYALDQDGKVFAQRRDGRFADPVERDRSHRWFLFDLPLAPRQTTTVYIRVRTDMGLRLDLRLTDRMRLAADDRVTYAWLALYFGAMLVMLAYNLLLLLQLREVNYFWLCVFIAGSMLWMADREGLLTTLTWRLWSDTWSGNQAGVALALTGLFMFPVGFLRLREHAPRLRWMSIGLSAVIACTPFLWQWSPVASYALVQATALLGGLGMLVTGALALRWQRRAAVQYLLAWSPLLIVIALIVITNYGLTPSFSAVWALTYAAILLMLLLLSVAQADRVNELRRRAERAQAALARNEQRLTELVDERTRELAVQRDRAEAASRAKTRFLGNMSHELRTPLNAVLGGADLLRRSPRLGAQEQDQCGLIQRGGRHLLRLIDDLLDVARIEHDRLRPLVTELSLPPMLDDLAAVTRRQAEAKGLTFEAQFAADLPELIRTDGRRLRQVLQNLLDNAVKYTDTGSVGLRAEPDPAASTDSGECRCWPLRSRTPAAASPTRISSGCSRPSSSTTLGRPAADLALPSAASWRPCWAASFSSTARLAAAAASACGCPCSG